MRSVMQTLVAAVGVFVPIGCAASTKNDPITADHPANPAAPESPLPARPDTLALGQSAVPAPGENDATKVDVLFYTCPMHKEVVSSAPGKCPKCGMKLVPKIASSQMAAPQPDGAAPEHTGHGGHQ